MWSCTSRRTRFLRFRFQRRESRSRSRGRKVRKGFDYPAMTRQAENFLFLFALFPGQTSLPSLLSLARMAIGAKKLPPCNVILRDESHLLRLKARALAYRRLRVRYR